MGEERISKTMLDLKGKKDGREVDYGTCGKTIID